MHLACKGKMFQPSKRIHSGFYKACQFLPRTRFMCFNPPRGFIPVSTCRSNRCHPTGTIEFQPSKRIHSGFYRRKTKSVQDCNSPVSTLQEDSFRFLLDIPFAAGEHFQLFQPSKRIHSGFYEVNLYRQKGASSSVSTLQEDSFRFLLYFQNKSPAFSFMLFQPSKRIHSGFYGFMLVGFTGCRLLFQPSKRIHSGFYKFGLRSYQGRD